MLFILRAFVVCILEIDLAGKYEAKLVMISENIKIIMTEKN